MLGGVPTSAPSRRSCRADMAEGCAGADLLAYRAVDAAPIDLVKVARAALDGGELIVAEASLTALRSRSWMTPASMASRLARRSSRVYSRLIATVSPRRCRPSSTACRHPANERCPRPAAMWRDRGGDCQRPRGRTQEAGSSAADGRSVMGPAFRPASWPADVRYHGPSGHRSVTQQMSANSHEPPLAAAQE